MTRPIIRMLVIGAIFLMFTHPAPLLSKTTSEDVSKQTKEAWEAFKAYMIDQKDDAVEHGEEALDKADAKIEELEGKAAKASGDAKVQYRKEIEKLKKMRANAAQKLDELKKSSADAWDDSKQGFTEAYEDLHKAYNDAVKNFK